VSQTPGEAHFIQKFRGKRFRVPLFHTGNQSGHHGILQSGKFRQEMMELKNKPDRTIPERRKRRITAAKDILTLKQDLSARGTIEGPENMEQRALAGA
jgi:hypothetical protein